MLIHFICRGNILRSIIAETYLKSLNLPDIETVSSGTNVDFTIPQEREFFKNTQALLSRHGLLQFAKTEPTQLTTGRITGNDVVIIVNERAFQEAKRLVDLPEHTIVWGVVDIGEGNRIVSDTNREDLEELVYQEITHAVDELVSNFRYNGY